MLYGQSKMTIGAYILIVILMFMVYRFLTKAVVPLIAITTVIAILNAFMFVFGIKQTMLSTTMNSMVLGLGIDFSIHVLKRYLEERGFDPMMSVIRTVERTGKAITTSAVAVSAHANIWCSISNCHIVQFACKSNGSEKIRPIYGIPAFRGVEHV